MIEPLVTTLLVPVCSCMCGIYPSFSFFLRRHRLLSPAVCGTNYANPYQHMFPVPQGRDFLSKSTRSAISGLYAFRFYSFSADMDRVGFDKVQVLTFLAVLWSWAIRSTINIFFRLLGYLRLPLRITRKVSSKTFVPTSNSIHTLTQRITGVDECVYDVSNISIHTLT